MAGALRIASGELNAEVDTLGAELVRLTAGDGRDYLWSGDPAWWNGRAPILFPIVGGLNGGRFRWHDRDYELPRHGFARRSTFAVIEQDAAAVRLRLDADAATRAVWPFEFRLDIIFAIEAAKLTITAEVTNSSSDAMPVSFGFHPAFRWPLPGADGKAGHVLRFERDEPAPIRMLDTDGLIDPVPHRTPVVGDSIALDDALFAQDALIFDHLRSRSLAYSGPGTADVKIDFTDMPDLGLWMKPGAEYLCIEPWQGHADPQGFAGTLDQKPGMVSLAPGEARRFGMGIAIA